MEIYHYRLPWLSIVFFIPAVLVFLLEIGVISHSDNLPWYVAYTIITICLLISLQLLLGSTRLYFDNQTKKCYQVRKHFYGKKIVIHPYSEIKNIQVRLARGHGANNTTGLPGYEVGFVKNTTMFGQAATKYQTLKRFGIEESDYQDAIKFGKQISEYSGIGFHDDTKVFGLRPL